MSNTKDIQEAAEKWAVDNCPSCNDRRYQGACVCRYLENAFLAGSSHSIGEELAKLINRLVELKPYHIAPYNLGDSGEVGEIIETIRSLINEQSLTNK